MHIRRLSRFSQNKTNIDIRRSAQYTMEPSVKKGLLSSPLYYKDLIVILSIFNQNIVLNATKNKKKYAFHRFESRTGIRELGDLSSPETKKENRITPNFKSRTFISRNQEREVSILNSPPKKRFSDIQKQLTFVAVDSPKINKRNSLINSPTKIKRSANSPQNTTVERIDYFLNQSQATQGLTKRELLDLNLNNKTIKPFRYMKSAGVNPRIKDETAGMLINPLEKNDRPQTPEHIKKYRKSYKHQVGNKILHHGFYNDPLPDENSHVYGVKTVYDNGVKGALYNPSEYGVKKMINEIREEQYSSKTKEPIGKSLQRNYEFPNETSGEGFRFGQPPANIEYTAKDVLFPHHSVLNESAEAMKLYKKSHGQYLPGEQKNRNYNWPIDPNTNTFGKDFKGMLNETNVVLKPDDQPNSFPATKIVSSKVEYMKNYKEDPLGHSKNRGQVNSYIKEDHVYGRTLNNVDQWSVAQSLKTDAVWKEVKPDESLGKTTNHGFRNITKNGDENRLFGVPTIRSDITRKSDFKSVADPNNYGDEDRIVELLFPMKYTDLGVSEMDFNLVRPKSEIRHLFIECGKEYPNAQFEAIFRKAEQIGDTESGFSSVRAFFYSLQAFGLI